MDGREGLETDRLCAGRECVSPGEAFGNLCEIRTSLQEEHCFFTFSLCWKHDNSTYLSDTVRKFSTCWQGLIIKLRSLEFPVLSPLWRLYAPLLLCCKAHHILLCCSSLSPPVPQLFLLSYPLEWLLFTILFSPLRTTWLTSRYEAISQKKKKDADG